MDKLETATLAGGCFWCTEAVFQRLKGVISVTPGYSGGKTEKPSYEEVSAGDSGHVEAVQIRFDPRVLSYEKLLEVFFATHDPTTLNRQGPDEGNQYRSVIFYHNEDQKKTATSLTKGDYVTEILPYENFYPAEDYHQKFYENNRNYPYCRIIIDPKINKLLEEFSAETKV